MARDIEAHRKSETKPQDEVLLSLLEVNPKLLSPLSFFCVMKS